MALGWDEGLAGHTYDHHSLILEPPSTEKPCAVASVGTLKRTSAQASPHCLTRHPTPDPPHQHPVRTTPGERRGEPGRLEVAQSAALRDDLRRLDRYQGTPEVQARSGGKEEKRCGGTGGGISGTKE